MGICALPTASGATRTGKGIQILCRRTTKEAFPIRPHKLVTSQRIAHWIKDLLGLAGIDTSIFKAHSTRGAATTAAHRKGVRVSDILQVADWSTESTFNRYYYRPNRDPAFARSVLSSIADNPNDQLPSSSRLSLLSICAVTS